MLVPIPALNDNYIWLYRRENFSVIVIDIPEITRLIPYLESNKLDIEAVLLTHNHDDHVQGVAEFKQYYPNVPVFGPTECANKGATNIMDSLSSAITSKFNNDSQSMTRQVAYCRNLKLPNLDLKSNGLIGLNNVMKIQPSSFKTRCASRNIW